MPAYFDRLVDNTNARPIRFEPDDCVDSSCRQSITGYDIINVVRELLIFPNGGGPSAGSPGFSGLVELLLLATENHTADDFEVPRADSENSHLYAYAAITCADWNISIANTTWGKYQNIMNICKIYSPHTRGGVEFWILNAQCQSWPVPPLNPQQETLTFKNGANKLETPILLVNTFYDPETSYAWAANMQGELGDDNVVLLSRNGSGHTNYFQPRAIGNTIDDYSIALKVPESGTVLRNGGI